MPTYRGYQTDPALARAATSIAGLFAPPSGAEAAGWANANATRDKNERLAQTFTLAANPNADRRTLDQMLAAAGLINGTQGFTAQDQNDATARRGQDLTAETARQNNTRDNTRQFAQTRFGAINEGQVLPALPASVGAAFGLPESPVVQGNLRLREGEDVMRPDGSIAAGRQTMPTRDQVIGAAMRSLPLEQQQMAALGGQGLQQVQGPNGPTYLPNAQAIGQIAFNAPSGSNRPVNGQATRNGQLVPTVQDASTGRWRFAQDGADVPADAQVTQMPQPTGSNDQISGSARSASERSLGAIAAAETALLNYGRSVAANPANQGIGGRLQGTFQNLMQAGGEAAQFFGGSQRAVEDAVRNNRFAPDVVARFGGFRTDIPATQAMRQLLIVQLAQAISDDSQVSNRDVERAEQMIGGGDLLSNQADTMARITATLEALRGRRTQLQGAAPAGARAFPGQPGATLPQPSDRSASPGAGDDVLQRAREAIQRGAPRDAVIQRLRQSGVDPSGL